MRIASAESFSARVMRLIMSVTRSSCGSVWSHHGCLENVLVGSAQGLKEPVGSLGIGGAGGEGAGAGGCLLEQVTSTATYLFLLLGQGSAPPFMLAALMSTSQDALPTQADSTATLALAGSPAQLPGLNVPQPPLVTGSPKDWGRQQAGL